MSTYHCNISKLLITTAFTLMLYYVDKYQRDSFMHGDVKLFGGSKK